MRFDHALAALAEEPLVKPRPRGGKTVTLPETGGDDEFQPGRAGLVETLALRECIGLPERLEESLLAAEGGAESERRLCLGGEVIGFARGADAMPETLVGRELLEAPHQLGVDADTAEGPATALPRIPSAGRNRRILNGFRAGLGHGRRDSRAATRELSNPP